MMRRALIVVLALPLAAGAFGCADREQIHADRMAAQSAAEAEDDATCRDQGEPGSEPYISCRQGLSAKRAQKAEIDYQKRRDFDRVLGGLDDL